MSHGYQHLLGIQRLTCLGGVVFAVVIMFQYFEFPYGDVISSLFSVSNNHITKTENYTPVPQILGDIAGGANSTMPADLVVKGIMSTYKGHDEGTTKDDISERKKELDDSKILNRNGVSGNQVMDTIKQNNRMAPEKEIESGGGFFMDNATNSTVSLANVSSLIKVPNKKQKRNVVSISEMLDILAHNRASSHSMKPQWSSKADQELLEAKLQIENAPLDEDDHNLHPSVFRNVSIFRRSYELMEKTLKVYIYKEGEKPIFNQPEAVMKGIYASEGWFMMQMKESKRFVTRKPKEAHLFYIPYSSKKLRETLSPYSHDRQSLVPYLKSYLDMISGRYSFWNRTGGADHFLVACHDWGAEETREFMVTCIRAICNTDVEKEGFELGKDVSLPTTNVRDPHNPLRERGGKSPSKRSILAFFAGKMHGSFRPILLRFWENKDPDIKIFGKLPQVKDDRNYVDYMKSSKFCICAKGSGVNSPRVVEAIFYECVPVIISDNFVPPFFEFLDWESFAVFIRQKDIPNLKTILLSIPNKRYLQMHQRVKQVQQHFLWHVKPVWYDIFHMILHSIWYNRVLKSKLKVIELVVC